ncbi:MAG: histidine phosphatase family protein [Pseudomonadales bacterium]|jgi:probable phosphoglycerate mutase
MFESPNRRRIFLLRHAEAAYVAEDGTVTDDPRGVGLTDLGRVQARKQAAVLASVPFDRAICSGLARTRETAKIILAYRDHPALEVVDALEEIRGGGRDQPVADVSEWLAHVANPWAAAEHPEATFLGGERFVDFAARVTPAFDAIIADQSWRNLLLVLHGAVNRMIFNHVMGLKWQGRMSIEQDNCCINIIDVDSDDEGRAVRYLIRAVNLTAYDLNKSGIHRTSMEDTAARIAATMSERIQS